MQWEPNYGDVVSEVIDFLTDRAEKAEHFGIARNRIFLDPGIGFGKRLEDNLKLLKALGVFKGLAVPIFIGLSRKSFIGDILKVQVQGRLSGTIAANIAALGNGANVLRVHDVKEAVEAVKIINKIEVC